MLEHDVAIKKQNKKKTIFHFAVEYRGKDNRAIFHDSINHDAREGEAPLFLFFFFVFFSSVRYYTGHYLRILPRAEQRIDPRPFTFPNPYNVTGGLPIQAEKSIYPIPLFFRVVENRARCEGLKLTKCVLTCRILSFFEGFNFI